MNTMTYQKSSALTDMKNYDTITMDVLLNGLAYRLFNIGWDGSSRRGESWEKFKKKGSENSVFIVFCEI